MIHTEGRGGGRGGEEKDELEQCAALPTKRFEVEERWSSCMKGVLCRLKKCEERNSGTGRRRRSRLRLKLCDLMMYCAANAGPRGVFDVIIF